MACTTHFNARDCREEKFKKMEEENTDLRIWKNRYLDSLETFEKWLKEERVYWGIEEPTNEDN